MGFLESCRSATMPFAHLNETKLTLYTIIRICLPTTLSARV